LLDPYLTNRPPERAGAGQIARASLQPIWDWISRDLMASMARAYAGELKQFTASGKQREIEQAVRAFQNKAAKYLDGTLASATGTEQARARLAVHGRNPATFDDLLKMRRVLKARDALARVDQELPARITKLEDERLERTLVTLDAFAASQLEALPFALTLVAKRLTAPWQLIRLATKATESKEAAEVAASPYAMAVTLVLDQLEDQVDVLRATLRRKHLPRAKEILGLIYDAEHAIEVRIDLDESEWGYRLDVIMQAVNDAIDSEEDNLPPGLQHVLRSPSLRNHLSLTGRLTSLAWRCRDAVTGALAYGRNLAAGRDSQA
jgi:hypothetical protein